MKILRKILGGISLTAAMFVFQACYGVEPDYPGHCVTFRVVSDTDGQPLPNIKISAQPQSGSPNVIYDWHLTGYTDSMGVCSSWIECITNSTMFRFADNDSVYAVRDTIIGTNAIMNYALHDTVDIVLEKVR